jgi:hypothetical protein
MPALSAHVTAWSRCSGSVDSTSASSNAYWRTAGSPWPIPAAALRACGIIDCDEVNLSTQVRMRRPAQGLRICTAAAAPSPIPSMPRTSQSCLSWGGRECRDGMPSRPSQQCILASQCHVLRAPLASCSRPHHERHIANSASDTICSIPSAVHHG